MKHRSTAGVAKHKVWLVGMISAKLSDGCHLVGDSCGANTSSNIPRSRFARVLTTASPGKPTAINPLVLCHWEIQTHQSCQDYGGLFGFNCSFYFKLQNSIPSLTQSLPGDHTEKSPVKKRSTVRLSVPHISGHSVTDPGGMGIAPGKLCRGLAWTSLVPWVFC